MNLLVELIQQLEQELIALKAKKQDIKQQITKLPTGTMVGRVAPQYQTQYDRLRHALRAVDEEIAGFYDRNKAVDDERTFQNQFAKQRLSITPEERSAQHGMAVKQGFRVWNDLRSKFGDDNGIEAAIKAAAKKLTIDGQELLNVDQLAKQFNVPARTMYKWLERPHLASIRMMMPNQQ